MATTATPTTTTDTSVPVILDCDAIFKEFSIKLSEEYEEAKENFALAKKMYQDVVYHIGHDLSELRKKKCKSENVDKDLEKLAARQDPFWKSTLENSEAQKQRVEALWAKLVQAEATVHEAGGVGNFALAHPTEHQLQIRHYHAVKLMPNFHEAKERVNDFLGFPDGYCTRVHLLHKQVLEQTAKALEDMKKWE